MKKIISLIIANALLMCMLSCASEKRDALEPIASPVYPKSIAFDEVNARITLRQSYPVENSTVEAVNTFAFKTSAAILNNAQANACFSPLSLYYALALAAYGAEGTTQNEMLQLLNFNSADNLSEQCRNQFQQLYTDNDISKLKIADSLWLNDGTGGQAVDLNKSYLDAAASDFYASIFKANFSSPETGKAMGKWISDNTNGMLVPKLETNGADAMSILNTVYFYDQWISEFNMKNTTQNTFYLDNGKTVNCSFMNKEYSGSYHKGEGYTSAWLPLKNSGRVVFTLPDEGVGLDTLVSSEESLKSIYSQNNDSSGLISWSIPKFSFGTTIKLKDTLEQLGMKSAFSDHANFSGMTATPLWISEILQETHISIDEKGVQAAAYTEIIYCGGMPLNQRVEMRLNRPFLVGIIAPNGTVLFTGVCVNPTVG